MSARRPRPGATLSRRRFVSLLATGSAALAAAPALAAKAAPAKRTPPATPPATSRGKAPETTALQKEFDRQRAGTLETLATLRAHALPPGGDLPVVFRPLRPARKGR